MTMELVKPLSKDKAKAVLKYDDIREASKELVAFLDEKNGKFVGKWASAYAIHHAQVDFDPFNFFVVAENVGPKMDKKSPRFRSRVIINPKIIERPKTIRKVMPIKDFKKGPDGKVQIQFSKQEQEVSNTISVQEACMSFPFRDKKYVDRFYRIKVRYQVKGFFGLKTVEEWVEGLVAHIFQHECDHSHGEIIYLKGKHK